MTDSTDNARGADDWSCAGCGISGPDTDRRCDCATAVVVRGKEGQWKTGPTWEEMRARRADLAPDPLRAVKVKSLVWEYHPAGAIAAQATGFAYIIDTRMKGRVYSIKGFNQQREFASMDAAKAAAQADYEARIRSALEPDPLADARVKALVEALKDWLELAEHCSITDGVCCCGENMENHSEPMECGHSPVDHAAYVARYMIESTRAALAAPDMGNPITEMTPVIQRGIHD